LTTSSVTRIAISLPESLLEEVDAMVKAHNGNRSEFVRAAMRCYMRVKRHRETLLQMQQGYVGMGTLNLELAAENLDESWELYERFLLEENGDE